MLTRRRALSDDPPKRSPLDALHRRRGARMTLFAGWELPVQFAGALAEHEAARTRAALFDVSHMGQFVLAPATLPELERLVPSDLAGLPALRQRYTLLLNEAGGIIDDIMVGNWGSELRLIVNAGRVEADHAHLRARLGDGALAPLPHALLALQGPRAVVILARHAPGLVALPFLGLAAAEIAGVGCQVSRSGYTGEDGFEISMPAGAAEMVAEALLADADCVLAGLAARDTLRLEAGLCLHGADIDEVTTPVEAGLGFTLARRRRTAGDFPGATPIADQLAHGAPRLRVGIRPEGRAIARPGTEIAGPDGSEAGTITSGTFAPSLGGPIAMGYVRRDLATVGQTLLLLIRGQPLPARVVALPFVPHRYAR